MEKNLFFDQKNLLTKGVEELLICPLCFGVLFEPVECKLCQHSYCKSCILKFSTDNCPYCDTSKPEFKRSHILLEKNLSKLEFKCKNPECKEKISYEKVLFHEKICEYSRNKCVNAGCLEGYQLKDKILHEKICSFKIVACPFCGSSLTLLNFVKDHLSKCEFRLKFNEKNKLMIDKNLEWKTKNCEVDIKNKKITTKTDCSILSYALTKFSFTLGIHYWEITLNKGNYFM